MTRRGSPGNNAEQGASPAGGIARLSRAGATFLHIIATSRLLRVLKADKKAIFAAASKASQAVDFLAALQAA
jgi:antirestriction protein ArdC